MRILTRYLIRAHVGPFVFALSTLTGLLFLNTVAQRLEDLAGKGLTADVILEFMVLSLPHTIALTLPMAVLVAVLYAFSDLTAHNEVTAMKAGGIRPQRMLLPLLGMGAIIAGTLFYFNDQVLPESNHRLKNLLLDINRKSPTFSLREQVVNQVGVGGGQTVFISAARIDNRTSEMEDVAIHDISNPMAYRTTYADRGVMEFNESRTDLYLTLYDGVVFEASDDQPGTFQQVTFERQVLPLRGVSNEMERRAGGSDRSDREMTVAMLLERADSRQAALDSALVEAENQAVRAVELALGRDPTAPSAGGTGVLEGRTAEAMAESPVQRPVVRSPLLEDRGWEGTALSRDHQTQQAVRSARTKRSQVVALRQSVNRYRVEVHKKITLSFACIVFVLVGAPLAIRFPRGGLGMVIAASSGIFAVYWAGLIGGEALADRGVAPPWLTMWMANIVFTGLGLWLYFTMGRESATTRGGGWDDLFWTVKKGGLRLLGRRPRRGRGGAEGADAPAVSGAG